MNNRLGYIDAIRGIAMLLVVYGHVNFYSFKITPFIGVITEAIQMPLFFFISGYVVYKYNDKYSFQAIVVKLWSKFKLLIVPAIVVGLCYTYLMLGKSVYDFFSAIMKYGYWFTFSLFSMNIIYILVYWVTQKKDKFVLAATLIPVAIILWCIKYAVADNAILITLNKATCLWHTLTHFPFFVLGVIISIYRYEYEQAISKKSIINTLLIISFILTFLTGNKIDALSTRLPLGGVLRLVLGFCGSLLVLNLSLSHKQYVENCVGRFFQFVGRRSLEIYLLHYFLLPDLTYAAEYVDTSSTIMGLSISMLISILIIAVCLMIGNIIRLSPFLSAVLLGVKIKK